MSQIDRRHFFKHTAGGLALAAWSNSTSARAADAPSERIRLGFMGVNSRGTDLARGFVNQPGAEIAAICDVDERAIGKCASAIGDKQDMKPLPVADFRRLLDDNSIDAIVIAAPDHWHGPATILACAAGKHVYVEKPACHNPREGELMVAAARQHNRVIQLGTQRRSWLGVREAIEKLHSGVIGKVHFARGWYNNARPTIGHGKPADVPTWLAWDLWQGPAPERKFHDNFVHYHWHWFWHWGTGELGNNGIHSLDVCRWGLGVDCPTRVTSGGGKYRYDDDQETPDTQTVTFDFAESKFGGPASIAWEGRSWHRRGFEGSAFGIAFYGDGGTLVIDGGNYQVLDPKGEELSTGKGGAGDAEHQQNFLECIRSGARPRADIADGVASTLLCHLGNIAYRTERTLKLDAEKRQVANADDAIRALWSREYRPQWEPKV